MTKLALLFAAATTLALAADPAATTWTRWELTLPVTAGDTVVFRGPKHSAVVVPGFTDDTGTHFRIAFPRPGTWTWSTPSKKQKGKVQVTNSPAPNALRQHGFLEVEPNRRYLQHADGTPFLWIGDTPWFAGVKATPDEWRTYIDDRAAKRFSVVQISAVRQPQVGTARYQPFTPAGQPNPEYWADLDAKVRYANDKGIVVLIVGLGRPTDPGQQPLVTKPEFARYVAARFFGDFVIYSPNFDAEFAPIFDTVAENLRAATPLHLITQHPNTKQGQNELYVPKPYLSFSGLQTGHHNGNLARAYAAARDWPASLLRTEPLRPVINIEGMYDGRGNNQGAAWREKDVRKIGWISWISGAIGYTYAAGETSRKVPGSNGGIWGWNQDAAAWDHWSKALAWPSSTHMTVMRDFWASLEWWKLRPRPDDITKTRTDPTEAVAYATASDLAYAVAYVPIRHTFTLDLSRFDRPLRATWIDPTSGARLELPDLIRNRLDQTITTPASGDDWVLLLIPERNALLHR